MENKPTHIFAKSLLYVARFHVDGGGGDIQRALAYVEKISQSNAEENATGVELRKRILALPGMEIIQGEGGSGASDTSVPPGTAI